MKQLLFIIITFISYKSFAQEYASKDYFLIDSIDISTYSIPDKEILETSLNKYHEASTDTGKVLALNDICKDMLHEDWKRYQVLQYEILQQALKKETSKAVTKKLNQSLMAALGNLGYIYEEANKIELALDYYNKSLELSIALGEKKSEASNYNNIGLIFYRRGMVQKALTYYHKSLKIEESIANKSGIATSMNNIGGLYQEQGDTNQALIYFKKSLALEEEIQDYHGMGSSLNNIASIYAYRKDTLNAFKYHRKGLEIKNKIGDLVGIAVTLNNMAFIYDKNGNKVKAKNYYLEALAIREKLGNNILISFSLLNLADLHYSLGEIEQASKYANRGFFLVKELGYIKEIAQFAEVLSRIEVKKNNYKDALNMYKLHIQFKDSIHNQENQKAVVQQQAKYEYEKQKAVDDAEHEKQLAIEQEAKEKQQILTYATAGGLGLVGIFLLFVFNRLKVTRKQKGIIELAHTELEEKNIEILDSITYAKRIQSAILPPDRVVKEYLQESFILYKPKDIVAGDFYWLEQKEGKILFAAADCTGHGVPGAMVSVVCNNGLNRSVREYGLTDPGKILDKTREIVVEEFEKSEEEVKDGMDIALCSLQNNTLQYAGAHNPLWIIRPRHSALDAESPNKDEIAGQASNDEYELIETKADKQPIGQFEDQQPYTTHTIELQKGDSVYIFSDGYADQFGGEKGKKMKTANFKKLLLSIQKEDMQTQKQLIDEAFEDWKGNLEQLDDVCVIGVRV